MRIETCACLLFLLSFCATTGADAAELQGKVVENELGGSPVAGVEIGALGTNPTASGSLGLFLLKLPSREPGEDVSLVVHKEGYEVVNDIQLEVTLRRSPQDRPPTIILCRPKLCEEMRRRFYRLKGIEAVEANYLRELRALEQSQQATAAKVTQLQEERDAALAAADRAAEDLARMRPAEGSKIYQEALRLFADGQLKEALAVLDEAKLQGSLAAARVRKAEAEQEIGQVVQGFLLRGKLLTLEFRFDDAEKAYRAAVEIAPENFEACFALAYFTDNQKRYAQATASYQRCLELARNQNDEIYLAKALNHMGNLLGGQNRLAEARMAYDEALYIRRKLASRNPDVYMPVVAMTLNHLGILLYEQGRSEEAQPAFDEALAIQRQLAKQNPDTFLPDVVRTLAGLGVLLSSQNRLGEARKTFIEAIAIIEPFAAKNPEKFQGLADSLKGLLSQVEDLP